MKLYTGCPGRNVKKLREGVPYAKIYRYNPKHLCPKLNGYGDNGQRKVWTSFWFHALYVVGLAAYLHCACPSLSGASHCSRSHIHVHVRLSVCAGVVLTTEVEVSYLLRKMPSVSPRGTLWHAFCIWILWWQWTRCWRRIPKTLSRPKDSV
jgi:hypothetical protein